MAVVTDDKTLRRRATTRAWYARTREKYGHKKRVPSIRRRNLIDLRALKLLRGCLDCGYDERDEPLEFDHLPEFEKIGSPVALAWDTEAMVLEIAKCEVVCANCHNIRTAERRRAS